MTAAPLSGESVVARVRRVVAAGLKALGWMLVFLFWFSAGSHAERAIIAEGVGVGVHIDVWLRIGAGALFAYLLVRRPADMRLDAARVVNAAAKVRGWSG